VTTPTAAPGNEPLNLNLAAATLGARAADPAFAFRPALSFVRPGDAVRRWTYLEAWETVERIGRGLLAAGFNPGDHLLVRLPHSPEFAFAFLGAVAAGLVPTPLSPQLTDAEVNALAADSEARALLTGGGLERPAGCVAQGLPLEALPEVVSGIELPVTTAGQPAYLIYTSGTGALPKGVLHAHRSLRGRALMLDAWEGVGPGDTVLHAGTLNWSYTLGVGLLDPWAVGAHAILAGGPNDPAAWPGLLAQHRVTIFAAVPTVFRQLLKYGRPEDVRLTHLRHGLCAGEPLSTAVAEEWTGRTGAPLYEALGMTEISTYISSGPATAVRPGSPGRPQPGRRVAILPADPEAGDLPLPPGETGLLAAHRSDPGLMLGYWNRPDEDAATTRGEWFTGGDLASMDADGYVWFQGRADDVIKSFGYRLSPVEIEAALAGCPGVAEVAVVGLAVDAEKTLVTACVVPSSEETPAIEAALRARAAERLAAYKQPHQYRFVTELPRTRNGKVQRGALTRALLAGDA